MNSNVVLAPTKSVCRNSGGRIHVAIQQQRRRRLQSRLRDDDIRRELTIGLASGKKEINVGPRFYTTKSTTLADPPSSMIRMHPSSTMNSLPFRILSSLATDSTGTRNDSQKGPAMATASAATILLGGGACYREYQKQKQDGIEMGEGETVGSLQRLPAFSSHLFDHKIADHNLTDFAIKHKIRPFLGDLLAGLQTNSITSTDMEPLRRQAVKNPISAQFHQPRNVMISRMRSVAGRGLHEKYKVEWNTVLGEGAYGSVHPARLALTGEKVALKKISKRFTNSKDFFLETNALLRIYDNGGHPNISGLRDMVSWTIMQRSLNMCTNL